MADPLAVWPYIHGTSARAACSTVCIGYRPIPSSYGHGIPLKPIEEIQTTNIM